MRTRLTLLIAATLAVAAGCASPGESTASAPPPEDNFTRVQRLIDEANTYAIPEGNYRIDVEHVWLAESDRATAGAIFAYRDNNVAARVGRPPARDPGFRIAVGGGNFRTALDATLRSSQRSQRTRSTVVTIADAPAYLDVGRVTPGVAIDLGPRRGVLVVDQQFVGTSLEAVVSPAGPGQATLRLTPVFSTHGRRGRTTVTEMSTSVRIPLGQPVLIGSNDTTQSSAASGILSRTSAQGREQAVVILTVTGG